MKASSADAAIPMDVQPPGEVSSNVAQPALPSKEDGSAEKLSTSSTEIVWQVFFSSQDSWETWWQMPPVLSTPLEEQLSAGKQGASYVWPWKDESKGSFRPHGEPVGISRYQIDFDTMVTTNLDTGVKRKVQRVRKTSAARVPDGGVAGSTPARRS